MRTETLQQHDLESWEATLPTSQEGLLREGAESLWAVLWMLEQYSAGT
jgi:hypothetical protein